MNRIEEKLRQLKERNEKAFITYMTAGLPDMEGSLNILKAQERAGVDIAEIGVPFSDPIADGPVIQEASYQSILKGTNLTGVFDMIEKFRRESRLPVVFMLYYNTVYHYGTEAFVEKCIETGVDGVIIPDLPSEEQDSIKECLKKEDAPILIQLVSPVSKQRIPMILKNARGFVYCVSGMGVTGQSGNFYHDIKDYLRNVKEQTDIPVMMGFGIKEAKDVEPVRDIIDGCIVGSHFITLMKEKEYSLSEVEKYISTFKAELNHSIS